MSSPARGPCSVSAASYQEASDSLPQKQCHKATYRMTGEATRWHHERTRVINSTTALLIPVLARVSLSDWSHLSLRHFLGNNNHLPLSPVGKTGTGIEAQHTHFSFVQLAHGRFQSVQMYRTAVLGQHRVMHCGFSPAMFGNQTGNLGAAASFP